MAANLDVTVSNLAVKYQRFGEPTASTLKADDGYL